MTQDMGHVRLRFGGSLTPIVQKLLWINGIVFVFLTLVGDHIYAPAGRSYVEVLISLLGLMPQAVLTDLALWQPLTYLFIHQAFIHLLFNMLALWWFGTDVERHWGSTVFFRYYLFTGIGAALTSIVFNVPTIGASGSIYGILLAYGFLFPNRILYLYFVIPVRAKYCVIAFALIELVALKSSMASTVNHFAHLGGMVFGLLWLILYRRQTKLWEFWRQFRKKRMRSKLRLIRHNSDNDEDLNLSDRSSNPTIH